MTSRLFGPKMIRNTLQREFLFAAVLAMPVLVAGRPVLASDCKPMIDQFNHSIDDAQEREAQAVIDRIAASADCGSPTVLATSVAFVL